MINRARIVSTFMELCRIHAESRKERPVAEYLEKKFDELGFSYRYDDSHKEYDGEIGNMFVSIPGTIEGPTLMISAHMDTVPTGGIVEPVIEGSIIRSAGETILGADDRAGLAQMIELAHIIKENGIKHPPILFLITSAEEIGLLGARYCNLSQEDASMGVILDTSGPIGKIVNSAPFHDAWKIKVHGKSSHAGIDPEKGINAITLAAQLIAKIPTGRINPETTANVARIHGGKADNIVPDLVTINGEARSRDEGLLKNYIAEVKTLCEAAAKESGFAVEFTREREYDGYTLPEDSPLIERLKKAATTAGKEPIVMGTGGGSDANFFNQKGVPAAVISCGMSKVHSYKEEIHIEDLVDTVTMILAFIKED